jgi:hypothetical protein
LFRVLRARRADVAQLVEHVLGKDGVSGSIPLIGSRVCRCTAVEVAKGLPVGAAQA